MITPDFSGVIYLFFFLIAITFIIAFGLGIAVGWYFL